jgi:adenosine deaminase CECR1
MTYRLRGAFIALAALAAMRPGAAADFGPRFDDIRRMATPAQLYAFLYGLPKGGDLHNHSGGANLPEWIWAVLTDPARNGGDAFYTRVRFANAPESVLPFVKFRTIRRHTWAALPAAVRGEYAPLASLAEADRAAWRSGLTIDPPDEGRHEFFTVSVWTRLGNIYSNPYVRVELLADNLKAFGAERVRYLEMQFGVDGLSDNSGRPIPAEDALPMLERRLAAPDVAASGVVVRFQMVVLRSSPGAEDALRRAYAFVDAHRDRWVGLNMAGLEEQGQGYPLRFLDTFRDLRRRHPTLPLSIHAGEMDGPDSHVRDTLLLGASRIGHGVNLIHDADTMRLLQQGRRVLVETSLISNRLLEYVPDLSTHPFPEYLRTGIPVCLNTDDRGMWSSNLTDEYVTAVTSFNLSWDEVVALGRNSLAYSFAQPEVKARLLADYDRDVAAFESAYGAGSTADALARLAAVRPAAYEYAKRTWGIVYP